MKNKLLYLMVIIISFSFLESCKKDIKTIIAETSASSFIIYTFDEYGSPSGSGSGFFIDENGTGITNYHVLNGSTKALLRTMDGTEYEIDQVIASDKSWDILKFSIKGGTKNQFEYLTFASKEVEQGDKIYCISAPLGLEQTVSDGIVSSKREDSHGQIIQVTTPISEGSSGSALLNDRGEVVAVATFGRNSGQNLNFGVSINEDSFNKMTTNHFATNNAKFNNKDNFIIFNVVSDNNPDIMLNALEFKSDATIGYFSFTNLNLQYETTGIWCELNKGDDGFLIHDKKSDKKYYLKSSTLGTSKANSENVKSAQSCKFKVFFPVIKDELTTIDIVCDYSNRGWQFMDINLDEYRSKVTLDRNLYLKEYAFSTMCDGEYGEAQSIFAEILNQSPEDYHALNALGVIAYKLDNNNDAEAYFSQIIDNNPSNAGAYINRSEVYKYQKRYKDALDDINKTIEIQSEQPDNYMARALIYYENEMWNDAKEDINKAMMSTDFNTDPLAYFYRAICNYHLGLKRSAKQDIQAAYKYTNDPEFEQQLVDFYHSF